MPFSSHRLRRSTRDHHRHKHRRRHRRRLIMIMIMTMISRMTTSMMLWSRMSFTGIPFYHQRRPLNLLGLPLLPTTLPLLLELRI